MRTTTPTSGVISGTVRNAYGGSPIAGATVTDGIQVTSSEGNGQYFLGDMSPGSYTVAVSANGFATSSQTVPVKAGTTTTANFALDSTTGSIVDKVTGSPDGTAIAGATVSLGAKSTSTSSTGQYVLSNVQEGSYTLTASADGYEPASLEVPVSAGQTATVNLALSPPPANGVFIGPVRDVSDGSPIAGAEVTDGVRITTTGSNRTYALTEVPQGTYTLTATAEGHEPAVQEVVVASTAMIKGVMGVKPVIMGQVVQGVLFAMLDVITQFQRDGHSRRQVLHNYPVGNRVPFEEVGVGPAGVAVDPPQGSIHYAVSAYRAGQWIAEPAVAQPLAT